MVERQPGRPTVNETVEAARRFVEDKYDFIVPPLSRLEKAFARIGFGYMPVTADVQDAIMQTESIIVRDEDLKHRDLKILYKDLEATGVSLEGSVFDHARSILKRQDRS